MGYYVYDNWTHERARVHIDSCSFCKHGRGTQPQDGGRMVAGCQAQVDHSQRERKPFNGHKLKVGKTPKVVSIASRERCALSLKQGNSTYLIFLSTWVQEQPIQDEELRPAR